MQNLGTFGLQAEEEVRDMSGPASTPTGQGSVTAAQMAIDDFGGTVAGKSIRVIVGDHQLKADIGAAIARRWYDVEQVDLIVDVPVSAVGLAVQTIANEKKPVARPDVATTAPAVQQSGPSSRPAKDASVPAIND